MITADDFFTSGGSGLPAFKFENLGDTLAGEITRVGEPFEREKLGKPGQTETTICIDIRADDGNEWSLWVSKVAMKMAIRDAVAAAGAVGAPAVGGRLGIQYHADKPSTTPGFNPQKLFVAQYVPPAPSTAANAMFDQAAQPAPQAPPAMAAATPTAAPAGPLV